MLCTGHGYEKRLPPLSSGLGTSHSRARSCIGACDEISLRRLIAARSVYNICTQRHSALLHEDFMQVVTAHLQEESMRLATASDADFFGRLHQHVLNFKRSSDILITGFSYLVCVAVMPTRCCAASCTTLGTVSSDRKTQHQAVASVYNNAAALGSSITFAAARLRR